MNCRHGQDSGINYADFTDCYVGLATMIFVQADVDLRAIGQAETKKINGQQISRWEIINFLRSEWAKELAASLGLTSREIARYQRRALGYGR